MKKVFIILYTAADCRVSSRVFTVNSNIFLVLENTQNKNKNVLPSFKFTIYIQFTLKIYSGAYGCANYEDGHHHSVYCNLL
jgi:hypothetical protein